MSNDSEVAPSLTDELEAMNVSEEDAILAGLEETEAAEEQTAQEEEETQEAEERKDSAPEDNLPKYEKNELLKIFDTVLFEGEYRETVRIGKNYTVKFRTRSVGESNDITRKVDALDLKTFLAVQNFTNVITLAYALSEIGNTTMTDMKFEDKYKKVKSLPESLIVLLSAKLFEFDRKVLLAMEEGQANF